MVALKPFKVTLHVHGLPHSIYSGNSITHLTQHKAAVCLVYRVQVTTVR